MVSLHNAMVALEQEATILKNRHGEGVLFGDQRWAEGKERPLYSLLSMS